MELETVNRLYLELSQFATAKTKQELELEALRASITWLRDEARVAARDLTPVMGVDTVRFVYMLIAGRLDAILVNSHKEPAP